MATRKIKFKSLNYNLVGVIEYQKEETDSGIILFHGLTNTKDDCPLIKEVSEALVKGGFITFRFDFYGSGESPGQLKDRTWSTMEQNARDAVSFFIRKTGISKLGLWGRSTGGVAAILCSDIPEVKAYVPASTCVLLKEVFLTQHFDKIKKLEIEAEKKGKKLPGTGKYKGEYAFNPRFFEETPLYEEKIMEKLSKMKNVLVLATTPDTKVPLNNSTTIINTVKEPKEIYIFEGVDHDYKGVEKEAVSLTVSWLKKWLR